MFACFFYSCRPQACFLLQLKSSHNLGHQYSSCLPKTIAMYLFHSNVRYIFCTVSVSQRRRRLSNITLRWFPLWDCCNSLFRRKSQLFRASISEFASPVRVWFRNCGWPLSWNFASGSVNHPTLISKQLSLNANELFTGILQQYQSFVNNGCHVSCTYISGIASILFQGGLPGVCRFLCTPC